MVWSCHDTRGRVNTEGCAYIKDDGTENTRQIKTNVAKLQQLQDIRNDRCQGLSLPVNRVGNNVRLGQDTI